MTISERQLALKARFTAQRGPDFLESYLNFSMVPWKSGPLEPKVKEFVAIAADAAATHLYVPGIARHIEAALAQGATSAEVMEVLELTSTLGIHAANIGVPILLEVLEEAGLRQGPKPFDARQERMKTEFTEARGYWHEFWAGILELDPDFFEAYIDFSGLM